MALLDRLGRPLRDLRISVTDRCNLRCTYCMPREVFGADYAFLPRAELLTFEEIERLARVFVEAGVRKLRVTGGEPLLRRDLPDLLERLVRLPGVEDVALTTNGVLLPRLAGALYQAGLRRVTVSLDALDPVVFGQMNGMGTAPEAVLAGIEAAAAAGLRVKVNTVVQRGVNDDQLEALWAHFRGRHVLRFIEFMDVGNHNGWDLSQVVPSAEVLTRLGGTFTPVAPTHRGEVASRYADAEGRELGLISSVTGAFCGSCSRVRLSAVGVVYTCLFASGGVDLRGPLRAGEDDAALLERVVSVWSARTDRYSEERAAGGERTGKVEMSHIGG
ncbi:GTP 3',8-cyclase MoaA [Deinococcus maricopensis]|uniref:GTP 3',8-cyclase n=1 Tax=Deinococcus maricopensis (strain DSM 21211 / LMG 22137 / NRRL B-23946 / LB-34) TaxID=709986 RepID=E8UBI6_DEIML|nr:GTP 3',8-cyclase MoaA [Deinococcus maricopensis]ADV68425.1 molybdenum cofactor biosynthesis protein A [Deinococcus maricopensis DSM 21211]